MDTAKRIEYAWLGFLWLVARVISLVSVLLLQRRWGRKACFLKAKKRGAAR